CICSSLCAVDYYLYRVLPFAMRIHALGQLLYNSQIKKPSKG
ncbi:MAG: hypothetical protein ACJART_002313, partial [Maribacter sp.]